MIYWSFLLIADSSHFTGDRGVLGKHARGAEGWEQTGE